MTSAVSGAGTSARIAATGVGGEVVCAAINAGIVSLVKGGRPVSISYPTTPNAYTSARWSTRSPDHCSGAM
ncbi:MAG: hypothetical protein U0132_09890 [Gemmatimonadaceae bacterium]